MTTQKLGVRPTSACEGFHADRFTAKFYDLNWKLVAEKTPISIIEESPGSYRLTFDVLDVPRGTYYLWLWVTDNLDVEYGLATITVTIKPKVLFDDTHDTDGDELTGWDANYRKMKSVLEAEGFAIDELNAGPITYNKLKDYDIVILPDVEIDLSSSEVQAFIGYLNNGGSLLIIGEWKRAHLPDAVSSISRVFGIEFKHTWLYDPDNYYYTKVWIVVHNIDSTHPIGSGVSNFGMYSGSSLRLLSDNAVAIAWGNGNTRELDPPEEEAEDMGVFPLPENLTFLNSSIITLAASAFSTPNREARLVGIGDSDLWKTIATWEWGRYNYDPIEHYDNKQLFINTIKWLAEPGVVAGAKYQAMGIETVMGVMGPSVFGTISQGQTKTHEFSIGEGTPEVKFELNWGGSDLDLHVYDPGGRHIGYNYATGKVDLISGATYSGRTAKPEWIRVQNPVAGTWRVEVHGYRVDVAIEPYVVEAKSPPDTTPPTSSITSPAAGSWHRKDFTVSISDSDTGGSGLDLCEYKVVSSGTTTRDWTARTCSSPVTLTVGSGKDCRYQGDRCEVEVQAEDKAGNWGSRFSRTFGVDWTEPVTKDDAPVGWQNASVTVTLAPYDAYSGIGDTYYCSDQTNTCTPTTSGTSVSIAAEGTNYVRYYSVDRAGNKEGVRSVKVEVDLTPPSGSIVSPVNGSTLDTSTVEASWSGSDVPSGIDRYEVQLDDTGWIDKGTATGHTYVDVSDGVHVLYVKALDKAGNQMVNSSTFTVETFIVLALGESYSGNLSQGKAQAFKVSVSGDIRRVKFTLDWDVGDLDLHAYDLGDGHVGYNYEAGEVEVGVAEAEYSGRAVKPELIQVSSPVEGDWMIKVYAYDVEGLAFYTLDTRAVVQAEVDINPDTLNLKSRGRWITAYIELPTGYSVEDIDATTILLEEEIQAVTDPKYDFVTNASEYITDHDGDGVVERMVKLERRGVQDLLEPDTVELVVAGRLVDGTGFEGSDVIRAIRPGRDAVASAIKDDLARWHNSTPKEREYYVEGVADKLLWWYYSIVPPDLAVDSSDIAASDVASGRDLVVNATIHNYGDVPASEFRVEFLVDGAVLASSTLSLEANSEEVVQFTWLAEKGAHDITIIVDRDGVVEELSEGNNIATVKVKVKGKKQ